MPQISVIIPAYNAANTIEETLKSVLQQTWTDFEVIVIDDGSTDHTAEIVNHFSDPRICLYSYANGGLPTARNRGIAQAKGELIAFLDADDLWTADKLELQQAALQQSPQAGVAYSWTSFMTVTPAGQIFQPGSPYAWSGEVYAQLLVADFILSGSNVLVRRSAIETAGWFDPALKSCEDWDYWLRLAARWPFVVVPKYQILRRQSTGAMTSNVEVMEAAALIAMEKAYQTAPPELQPLKRYTMTNFHRYCAGLYLQYRSGSPALQAAQSHLCAALRLSPFTLTDRLTQTLIIKLLLARLLPTHLADRCVQFFRKQQQIADPRLP
ncbi:MAG: glycosyltransferase family 2 protein [Elainella sp. Prado103]|jgi:glycosyltransferase involved in cell wall biosynthesis|nr:glycosyltransferase family 2 protein [Elainella sp. Prado103]